MSSKHKSFKRFTLVGGASLHAFHVGFSIDGWSAFVGLGFVWIAVEW